jgi:hypothetical protein
MSIEESVMGALGMGEAGDSVKAGVALLTTDQKKRGRKAGSKVKVKGGAIKVSGPRKQKVSHGWFLRMGVNAASGGVDWDSEDALVAKSVKTALREAKDLISQEIELVTLRDGETFAAQVYEVKYQNLDVRCIPQKPKVVL